MHHVLSIASVAARGVMFFPRQENHEEFNVLHQAEIR